MLHNCLGMLSISLIYYNYNILLDNFLRIFHSNFCNSFSYITNKAIFKYYTSHILNHYINQIQQDEYQWSILNFNFKLMKLIRYHSTTFYLFRPLLSRMQMVRKSNIHPVDWFYILNLRALFKHWITWHTLNIVNGHNKNNFMIKICKIRM